MGNPILNYRYFSSLFNQDDSERAAQLLAAANEADVGLNDYLIEIENYLKSKGCTEDHIKQEIEKIKDIGYYLKYD